MTRRKVDPAEKLTHKITIHISEPFNNKMKNWLSVSNAKSLAELARLVLYKEEIIWYHKDETSEVLSVELTAIRKELNAIGTNINQVTRYFNSTAIPSQKIYEALRILEEYKKVNVLLDKLTELINQLQNGRDRE